MKNSLIHAYSVDHTFKTLYRKPDALQEYSKQNRRDMMYV